ncbi:MAG TPA: CBS domain-containing protein [Coriobacteriia bacterium]
MTARDGITIVAGHVNPDFDAYGAMVAATKLYPGARAVWAGTQNSNVREFHALHGEFLAFTDLKGFDRRPVSRLVMVDTRDASRLGELASLAEDEQVELVIYDHHPRTRLDVKRGMDRSRESGATTSILVHEIRKHELTVTPLEASAMLLGIHEDTGSLTYPGATAYDADAVAFLMAQGADLEVVERFLNRSLTSEQRDLLEDLTESLKVWEVHGRPIAVAVASAAGYVDSAGLVTHHLVEDLGHRVAIAVVSMPERVQLVGRSRLRDIDIAAVLAHLGGGGHPQAASAALREAEVAQVLADLRDALEAEVPVQLTATDIATSPVRTITEAGTMDDAAEAMARWGHALLPVMRRDEVSGFVTRRDVDKAVRHGLGHAPVTGFMTRVPAMVAPDTDLEELERLMSADAVPAVFVLTDGKLSGLVTHADLLRAEHGASYLAARAAPARQEAAERFRESFETLLPAEVRDTVREIGAVAQEEGVRAFVVGGFVRDMLLRRRNLDVDIVVEGDGIAFAHRIAARLGGHVRAHARFGTAVVVLQRGLHVDVTTARTEYYTSPGALPTVERSSLRRDLLRRDFSINAMAAEIDPVEFGAISDPFGGLGDLRDGLVRVLHPLSFVEDPTRVARAARFEQRFGFAMDDATEDLARRAVGMGLLQEISGARLREELLAILEEDDPTLPLERLEALGALRALLPAGVAPRDALDDLRAVLESLARMPCRSGRPPRRVTSLLVALAGRGAPASVEHWAERLRLGRDAGNAAREAASRAPVLLRSLDRAGPVRDSRLHAILDALTPEALVYVRATGSDRVRERVDRYAGTLSHVRIEVCGDDLIALGAEPSAVFSDILSRIRARRLDGAVAGRTAELDELRRLAQRAGLVPRR